MKACAVLFALVAVLAVANGFRQVEHLVFTSPEAGEVAGPVSVKMIYDNNEERIFPNDDDHDENDYDSECEDEPGETFCAPQAFLGYTTAAQVGEEYGDAIFGKARNDVGDELTVGYDTVHGRAVTGAVTMPVLSTDRGQKVYALVNIDGGADKISSIYRVQYDVKLNRSDDVIQNTQYVDTRSAHGVLSPTQPRITSHCTSIFAEQIAPDAYALQQDGVVINDADFVGKTALEHYNHPRPGGTNLDDVQAWHYGWPVEAAITDVDGSYEVSKRWAFGRGSWDGIQCMPDGMTCLFWGEGLLFAFVAEQKMGLDYGRLFYAAGIEDNEISWMEMGRMASEDPYEKVGGDDEDTADDPASIPDGQGDSLLHEDEIAEFLNEEDDDGNKKGQNFDRVFMTADPTDGACASGYTLVDGMCLKLHDDCPSAIAARLETVRYAKYLGAAAVFQGLSDTTFSREFRETEDDDRGAIWMAFSMVSEAQRELLPSGADDCGVVFRASLTSWKDISNAADDDEDPEYETETVTSWLPKTLSVEAAGGNTKASECSNGIRAPVSLAWAHFHNMLLIGTDGSDGVVSAVIGVETDATWLESSGTSKYQTLYRGHVGSTVQGLTWNQNMIGNGDAYLTFGIVRAAADEAEGEFGIVGPMRMRGYIAGSADQLQNLGCPLFAKNHYLYKERITQEWPIPEEDEDED